MKSRQKFIVSEKTTLKRSESEPDYHLDHRVKRKISSNPLFQKNINFLQTYNNLFRKPSCQQIGDAENYFRQSLRNEPFDLIRDLNLQSHLVKSVKSFESLNKRKPRSKRTLLSPKSPIKEVPRFKLDTTVQEKEVCIKEIFSADTKDPESGSDTESDDKDFYSPTNEPLQEVDELSEGDSTPKVENDISRRLDLILKEEPSNNMEGEDGFNDYVVVEKEIEEYENQTEEGDDEMKEVEQMIEQAADELQQVVEDNKQLMSSLVEEGIKDEYEDGYEDEYEDESKLTDVNGDHKDAGDGSIFKFDPTIDAAVLKELEDAEQQAKETAKVIQELKRRVAELLTKEKMTTEEAKELEQKNKELKSHMAKFEEKTKRIQFLIGQTNLFDNMIPIQPALQSKHNEDVLPKVIVCGFTENNMPKIIVCDDKRKCTPRNKNLPSGTDKPPESPTTQYQQKLNECYCMQEKLASENANLEDKRYKLQSDLINKDQTVECLQKQLCNLQTEMRMVCQENSRLNEQLQMGAPRCGHKSNRSSRSPSPGSPNKKMPCGKGRMCPADIQQRLQQYSENTQNLEKQLGDMEVEVRNMQQELIAVQKEREHLEHHRKMMCPPPPCIMPPCAVPPCGMPPCGLPPCGMPPCGMPPCLPPPCPPSCDIKSGPSADQQLRELREQYNRLQDDFKSKLTEVAGLRADNERLKDGAKNADDAKKAAEDKLKEVDTELKNLKNQMKAAKGSGTREQLIEQEQQLNVAKQRFREAQDELEELRALVQDQQGQLDDYRNKYMEAQQQVEEQRRQIDLMEIESQRVSEQVNLEIQRVKNQFQEKVQELMPLPDILKSTQLKLQEAQQMHLLAERNNEAIARELQMYKDKIAAMTSQMDQVRSDQQLGADEKATMTQRIEELEQRLEELTNENCELQSDLDAMSDKADESQRLAEERLHEITQLESQLDSVREETARQVARTKDRCEIVRRSMQNQISDLERQLAQSRALAKSAQKDRDDIRQKMQAQINNLNENFDDAQMRIRNLQGHVNFLKNSYGNTYADKIEPAKKTMPDPCSCSADY